MIEGKKFFKSWALVAQRLTSIQEGLCEDPCPWLKMNKFDLSYRFKYADKGINLNRENNLILTFVEFPIIYSIVSPNNR